MAIKNLIGRGIGFTDGDIRWLVTRGYGSGGAPSAFTVDAAGLSLIPNNGALTLIPNDGALIPIPDE